MNKIETKKGQTWKDKGIYDFVQLSRVGPPYCQNMLVATLYFWESSTNTLQIPYGMITLTLFDVVTITSLRPTSDNFDPTKRDEDTINFNTNHVSFGKYIEDHHNTTSEEVFDEEHIAFSTL